MKRSTVNALVDLAAMVTFIISFITGVVLYFFLPSGGGGGGGHRTYLDIPRDQWLNMHDYSSFIFAGLVILHILLHWIYFRNLGRILLPKK